MALGPVGQIHISVTDIDASVAFYRDVLGIPLLFQVPGRPMAFFASGDVRLYLGVPEGPEFRSKVVLYFTVTDIDAEYERLRDEHGLSFTGKPHVVHRDANGELWMTFTRDPDDQWIGLMQQRESSSAIM
jgi:predicted enzyme related to lactoylglutathione lyase